VSLANNPKGEPSKYRSPHPHKQTSKGNKMKKMSGVTFTTMETVGIRTYTFEIASPMALANLTSELVTNLASQGGSLVTMEVN